MKKDQPAPEATPEDKAIMDIFDFILSRYSPADNYKQASLTLTTNQIYTQIMALYPAQLFSEADLFTLLKENGFIFDAVSQDMKFVWLLKEK
jgi:hypothetical protein